jgi:preprotein translocase SecE subunit
MASVTKNDEKTMATDVTATSGGDEPEDRKPQPQRYVPPSDGGFFHIVKRGQGYWTRMGTAGVAAMLIALISFNTYLIMAKQFAIKDNICLGVAVGVAIVLALLSWRLMNKPGNVDFLIATDSEMKKVNWTSRKDLMGATKVVIIFMFLIAGILLLIDVIFGYFFQLITVLKFGPFG